MAPEVLAAPVPPVPATPVGAASAAVGAGSAGLSPVAVGLMMLAVVLAIGVGVWIGRGGTSSVDADTRIADGTGPSVGGSASGRSGAGGSEVGPDGGTPSLSPSNSDGILYADSRGDSFLALRTEPSVGRGQRIGQIPHGVGVEVLDAGGPTDAIGGVRGRWVRVRARAGTGWVFDGYTTTEGRGRSAATVEEGVWATVNGPADGALNLRTGPDNETRVVEVMRRGEEVYVPFCRRDVEVGSSGYAGRWCRVRLDRGAPRIGWAFDAFLNGVGG